MLFACWFVWVFKHGCASSVCCISVCQFSVFSYGHGQLNLGSNGSGYSAWVWAMNEKFKWVWEY